MQLPSSSLHRPLVALTLTFSALGLLAELLRSPLQLGSLASLLSLSFEGNLPSWYASALPLVCAGLRERDVGGNLVVGGVDRREG